LFVFAFLNHPLMLGWLAAAAAPLVIHLLSKRKYRQVQWAAMQYLLAALRKNSRRIQIEQWLLLAMRTLLIALLVMAMAEPVVEHAGLQLGSTQRTHKVLVIDGSYSMAYKPSDKSRFDRAKELADHIVDESSQGDGFTLVLMSAPPRVVVGTPAFEPREFRQEIDNLRLPHGGGDLAATLVKVEELLTAAAREYPRLVREEVYFLSDMGRTTWAPELRGPTAAKEFLARSQRLSKRAKLYPIDLGQAASDNQALTALATAEPFATVSRQVTLEGEVHNFGRQPRPHQLVELFVDGRRAGEEHVDLTPGGSAAVAFSYRFENAGNHAVELRLAGDLLDIDNHRWLALPVKERLRVLCVNGKPGGGSYRGATDYLTVALAPASAGREQNLVQPDVVAESGLLEADLGAYDCVFLANVGQFTASEVGVLAAYLRRGGGLVFFLGDQVQADNYNRRLSGQSTDGLRVLPATLAGVAPRGQYRFNPLGYQHPLLAPFREQEQGGLLTTPIFDYVKLLVPGNSTAKVALGFDTGDPAIVEDTIGRGRSIVVATSADTSWNTMPMWPSYLPVVQELLNLAVRGQQAEHNVLVGQSFGDATRSVARLASVQVRNPAGEASSVRPVLDGDYSTWSYHDTSTSGTYAATLPAPAAAHELFAVNVDTAESDLAKIDNAELRDRVWSGVDYRLLDDFQDFNREPSDAIVRRNSVHQFLLVAALVLLLLESLTACYFGRRAA
jgi:hypothetical protein